MSHLCTKYVNMENTVCNFPKYFKEHTILKKKKIIVVLKFISCILSSNPNTRQNACTKL